jgi:hypothetical protein
MFFAQQALSQSGEVSPLFVGRSLGEGLRGWGRDKPYDERCQCILN